MHGLILAHYIVSKFSLGGFLKFFYAEYKPILCIYFFVK